MLVKPKAFEAEELDPNDPNNLYFIYICIKQPDLVLKKKKKEKKIQNQRQNKKTKKAPKI
jgi:stalled ribosome rescue protein Dom34